MAFSVLTIALSAALGGTLFVGASRLIEDQVRGTLLANADRLAEGYSAWIDSQLGQLETIAEIADLTVYDDTLYGHLATAAKRLGFNSMSPADLNGILHLAGGRTADLSKRPYLQTVLRERKPAVSEPVFSAVAGEENLLTVLFAVPVIRNGELVGALIGQRNAEFLSDNLKSVDYGPGSSNYIISPKGTPVAHTDPEQVRKGVNAIELAKENSALLPLAAIIEQMIAGGRGIGDYSYGGIEKYVGYAPINRLGWSVGIAAPKKSVLAPLLGLRVIFILVAAAAIVLGIGFAFLIGNAFTKPLRVLSRSFQEISQGDADLTKRIDMKSDDEIGSLVVGFNTFVAKLQDIMVNLRESQDALRTIGSNLATSSHESASAISEILANIDGVRHQSTHQAECSDSAGHAVETVSRGIEDLESLIETQASGTTQASASIEEMVGNIASVTGSVEKMAQYFTSLMEKAADGRKKQEEVDGRIKQISAQSEQLMEANTVIAGIAAQTNLLAMNAAIEAAHAGDAGRGFSVVADEIRRLSQTSAEQSRKIRGELSSIRERIFEMVTVSQDSESAFSDLSEGIQQTDSLVKQIELAMSEQREGSKQVLEALREMGDASVEVRDRASVMKREVEEARTVMSDLAQASATILNSMDEMGAGAQQINQAAQTVADLAEQTNGNIRKVEDVIGRFTV